MKIEGLLPLGSVVRLAAGEHRIMITGYGQRLQGQEEVNDYVGCLWPEGHQSPDKNYVFNAGAIEDVLFLGFQTDGQKMFVAKMETALADYRKKKSAD